MRLRVVTNRFCSLLTAAVAPLPVMVAPLPVMVAPLPVMVALLRVMVAPLAALLALLVVMVAPLAVVPASAQQVEIKAPPPAREGRPEIVVPGLHYEKTRPSDSDYYPQGQKVEHDPAFVEPFTIEYETGTTAVTVGLSVWTSPATPVGPSVIAHREVPGWLGFGFSVAWGGPPASAKRGPAR